MQKNVVRKNIKRKYISKLKTIDLIFLLFILFFIYFLILDLGLDISVMSHVTIANYHTFVIYHKKYRRF